MSKLISCNDWFVRDTEVKHKNYPTMTIHLIGRTETGESVCVNIHEFLPQMYINIPENFTRLKQDQFMSKYKTELVKEDCKKVKQKDFYGFHGEQYQDFYELSFKNIKSFKKLKWDLKRPMTIGSKKYDLKSYNSSIDPLLQFFHTTQIQPSSVIEISNFKKTKIRQSTCDLEYDVYYQDIKPTDKNTFNTVECSYDIEVYSRDDTFPKPEPKENVITHIGMVYRNTKYLLSLDCNKTSKQGVQHFTFEKEKDLLLKFVEILHSEQTDVMYQWNGDQFDGYYIYTRMKLHKIDMSSLSRIKNEEASIKTSAFTSSAYGTTFFKRLIIPGIIHFDVMTYFSRNFKEDSYSLDSISRKYLNNQKEAVSVNEMFKSYRYKDKVLALKVAEYCLKDCVLPQLLIDKFSIFTAMRSMSNVTNVPITYLLYRGQQIKAYSQISLYCKKQNYIIPDEIDNDNSKYTGATVLEPNVGIYTEPTLVLDFASLYPSIIRAHNLCYSSIVLDPQYDNLEGYTYETFDGVTFVQNNKSILPGLLEEMAKSRKKEKKLMAAATGLQETIHDMNQNAYKISMNSVYGFLAAQMLQCKQIASTVTLVGRNMILATKEAVEKYPFLSVIYGDTDSVFIKYSKDYEKDIELIEFGERLAKEVSVLFKSPILLEFEKMYRPFMIFSKKRYVGKMFSIKGGNIIESIQSKGVVMNRRDNCPLLRVVYKDVIDIILKSEKDFRSQVVSYITRFVRRLKNGEYPIEELTISKKLGAEYKNKNLPQVVVADKMRKRQKDVQVNDRIPFVFIKTGKRRDPQYKRVEDPEYVEINGIDLDFDYYIDSQFRKPLQQLLEVIHDLQPRYTRVLKKEERTPELEKSLEQAKFINNIFK